MIRWVDMGTSWRSYDAASVRSDRSCKLELILLYRTPSAEFVVFRGKTFADDAGTFPWRTAQLLHAWPLTGLQLSHDTEHPRSLHRMLPDTPAPTFSREREKRLVKAPKVYLRDNGILHYLL